MTSTSFFKYVKQRNEFLKNIRERIRNNAKNSKILIQTRFDRLIKFFEMIFEKRIQEIVNNIKFRKTKIIKSYEQNKINFDEQKVKFIITKKKINDAMFILNSTKIRLL